MDKNFICKLALERCRLNVSHLCALTHLSGGCKDVDRQHMAKGAHSLFENLNRDLCVLEDLLNEE